jgi:hypothetical protein
MAISSGVSFAMTPLKRETGGRGNNKSRTLYSAPAAVVIG